MNMAEQENVFQEGTQNFFLLEAKLREAILSVMVFFDQFSYPLTAWEIWRGIYNRSARNVQLFQKNETISFHDVLLSLEEDQILKEKLFFSNGYFCLNGSGTHSKIRRERYIITRNKYKKAGWFFSFLAAVPFIRFIGVCNSLSCSNVREESDIDLFIITEKGFAHVARMIAGFFAAIFRMRPKKKRRFNAICLSFFIDAESLDLSSSRIHDNDVYFHYWLAQLVPLYDESCFFGDFFSKNAWIESYFPCAGFKRFYQRQRKLPRFFLVGKKIGEWLIKKLFIGSIREKVLLFEEKHFSPEIRALKNQDTRVIVSEHILKFHPVDRREEYWMRWKEKMQEIC